MKINWKKTITILGTTAIAVGILVFGIEYSEQIKTVVNTIVSKIKK